MNAPPVTASSTKKPKTASQSSVTDNDLQHHSQQLGKIGSIFGSRENAPVYIAGIIGFVALIGAISVGLFAPVSPDRGDLFKALIGIVVAALSFIGGASGRGHNA